MRWLQKRAPLAIENMRLRNRVEFLESEVRATMQDHGELATAYAQQEKVLRVYRAQLAARDAAAVRKRGRQR